MNTMKMEARKQKSRNKLILQPEKMKEQGSGKGKQTGEKRNRDRNIANLWNMCLWAFKFSTLQKIKIKRLLGRNKHK